MAQPAIDAAELTFENVEIAVRATRRGRWFLDEFARRNRSADTMTILEEVRRLQAASDDARVELLRGELQELSDAISTTRQEIAQIRPKGEGGTDRIVAATGELDAIVTATERATSDILGAAEALANLAGKLRSSDNPAAHADEIEMHATNILMACSFQDITGQRTNKVVNTLRYLEKRVNAMVQLWGGEAGGQLPPDRFNPEDTRPDADLLHGPAAEGEGVSQDDIDAMLNGDLTFAETPKKPTAPKLRAVPPPRIVSPEPATQAPSQQINQSDIDSLFD